LIAVSKTKSASDVQQAIDAGQRHFGVGSWSILTCNKTLSFPLLSGLWSFSRLAILSLSTLCTKIAALENAKVCWHFIGPIQSNRKRVSLLRRCPFVLQPHSPHNHPPRTAQKCRFHSMRSQQTMPKIMQAQRTQCRC
jgi:hypothetical protein